MKKVNRVNLSMNLKVLEDIKKDYKKYFLIILLMGILFFLNYYWFYPLKEKGFLMGDDIRIYNILKYSENIWKTIFTNDAGVYRPVSYFFIAVLVRFFGTNYDSYFIFNMVFNCVILCSVFYVIYQMTEKKELYIPFIGSIFYLFSIYSYYGITQMLGLMEQMCVFLCVWFFYCIIRHLDTQDFKYYVGSVIIYFLIVLTHERFLALFGVYIIYNIFVFSGLKWKRRIQNLAISALPALYFTVIKLFVFNVPLFVGTGQTKVKFSFLNFMGYIGQSIASMFGVNNGENHLFGFTYENYTDTEKHMIVFLVIIAIVTFIIYFVQCIRSDYIYRKKEIQKLIVFIFLEGATIVCYCISSRIEMREIYVPYTLLIIYIMYCINKINLLTSWKTAIIAFILCINSIHSYIYKTNIDSLFFMRSMRLAKTGYAATLALGEEISSYKIYIVNDNELNWAMLLTDEKDIFYMYLGHKVQYEQIDDIAVTERKINEDLNKGEKVKVIYINSNFEVTSLDYVGSEQEVNLQQQMGR